MGSAEGSALAWLTPQWPAPAPVRAAVTLRGGGVSAAPYASLNLATHVGDAPAAVQENRRRLSAALALPGAPQWLTQVHGSDVLRVPEAGSPVPAHRAVSSQPPAQADAAVSATAGAVLAVLVADCLPVLFASADGRRIGIAHAGWRGLAAGVLEATVAALQCPPGALHAWLGPAIGPAHFEVGEEVRAALCAPGTPPEAPDAFARSPRGRWQCDLPRLARQRLIALGVRSLHGDARCTYQEREAFYSYRRDGLTGRLAALIWLAG